MFRLRRSALLTGGGEQQHGCRDNRGCAHRLDDLHGYLNSVGVAAPRAAFHRRRNTALNL
jgi:hypothetical protein